jgi:hypothetical protein
MMSESQILALKLQLEQQSRDIAMLWSLLKRGAGGGSGFTTQTVTVVTSVACDGAGNVTGTTRQIRVLAEES